MAVSTPAGFTTIVTPPALRLLQLYNIYIVLYYMRDNFCALTNSCRHASSVNIITYVYNTHRKRIWRALQFFTSDYSFRSLYRTKILYRNI